MDELIKLVTDKIGISPDQAEKAVETVLGFLRDKLPAPIAGQIDKIIGGEGESEGGGVLGGLFS